MVSATGSRAPLALAAVAIVIAAVAVAQTFTLGAQTGDLSSRVDQQASTVQTLSTRVAPKTQTFSIFMGEGEIIQEVAGEEELTGEFHRWEPAVLVVQRGDTIALEVCNPRKNAHSFVLTAFGVDTGRIPGRAEEPDAAKRCATETFIADKAGIFQFNCGIPHDHALGNCDPDHARMTGYLVVLE